MFDFSGTLFRLEEDDDTGADRLVHFIRARQLSRDDVDKLLSVAELMFSEGGARRDDKPSEPARCARPDCGRPVLARGLCVAHYHRARRAKSTSP